jgi:hypothetical protein
MPEPGAWTWDVSLPRLCTSRAAADLGSKKLVEQTVEEAIVRVGPYRYSLLDRALGYFTLFLLGLIGWIRDRLFENVNATRRLHAAHVPSPSARQH